MRLTVSLVLCVQFVAKQRWIGKLREVRMEHRSVHISVCPYCNYHMDHCQCHENTNKKNCCNCGARLDDGGYVAPTGKLGDRFCGMCAEQFNDFDGE